MKKGYLSAPSPDAGKQPWFNEKHYYYRITPLISSNNEEVNYRPS